MSPRFCIDCNKSISASAARCKPCKDKSLIGSIHCFDNWSKIIGFSVEDDNGCWWYIPVIDKNTYGKMYDCEAKKVRYVHIIAYEEWIGLVSEGLELDHVCGNKPCCNPGHLEPVTSSENKRRWWARRKACNILAA